MYRPTEPSEIPLPLPIPHDIGSEFFFPEACSTLRRVCKLAVLVSVPETAVYEHDGPQFRENNIRATRESAHMDAEAEA